MTTIAAIILVLCLAATASAQDTQSRFDRLDKDGDGQISWSEAYKVRSSEFLEMDSDMNGLVVEAELKGRARGFAAFDLDGDGQIQLSEYLKSHRMMFTKFDVDGTGSIDLREFGKAQAAVREN